MTAPAYPSLIDLHFFLEVVRSGSLGAAAERCGLTQPSLSRRMSALEHDLGVELLRRTRQGSEPTEAGLAVADWATGLLESAEEFSTNVAAIAGRGRADLRLAASLTIAEHHMPEWLGRLREVDASVQPRLSIGNSEQVAQWVRHGDVELGFIETPDPPDDLSTRDVGVDPLCVAVAPAHLWAGRTITVDELAGEPLLLREQGSGTRLTLEHALAEHDLEVTSRMELTSNSSLRASAKAGLGPVVLSRRVLAGDLATAELRAVTVEGLTLERRLAAIIRPRARLSGAARMLMEVCAKS